MSAMISPEVIANGVVRNVMEFENMETHIYPVKATRKASLFTIYAKVFRVMISALIQPVHDPEEEEFNKELDELILPSNDEWRHQVYYRLVDLQREIDAEASDRDSDQLTHYTNSDVQLVGYHMMRMKANSEKEAKDPKEWEWEPGGSLYPLIPKGGRIGNSASSLAAIMDVSGSMTEACIEPGWRVEDLLLAAKVLQKEESPIYSDEAEMRRVFGLVYDVLRYKKILNHALDDVAFWYYHPKFKSRERIVWLLLYDMQGRKFARRGDIAEVEAREKAFEAANLKEIEDTLLNAKIRLAASVSRLRIEGSALTLGELLPLHLRNAEGVVWGEEGALASGWINSMKISSKKEFIHEMSKIGLRLCVDCTTADLEEDSYAFDPLCPKVVNLHDKAREKLAKFDLVRNHCFIFLERSLCLGAAALAQAVRIGKLCGPVVLTHSIAPRHAGYLASLLADIDDAGRLLVFGTGELRCQYELYLRDIGVTLQQCRVFSEKYVNPPPCAELERATIILATPPCSYTGIRDAVDLAVARGGDTTLLETLTNMDNESKQPQVLLSEQLSTLKYALTRPNVQLLIYETHSILPAETTEVVEQVLNYANKMAAEKFAREYRVKKKAVSKEAAGKMSKPSKSVKRRQTQEQSKLDDRKSNYEDEEELSIVPSVEIKVPDSDLFEHADINEICGNKSSNLVDKGCYLALIRRKEMMQFNSLFMIKVAETKGLFGDPNKQQQPKEEPLSPIRQASQTSRKDFKRAKFQVDRIAAPTHSSMVRAVKEKQLCPRHNQRIAQGEKRINAQADNSEVDLSPPSLSAQQLFKDSFKLLSGISQDLQDVPVGRGGRLKSQQAQEENIRRLSTPTHSSMNKMVNRKNTEMHFSRVDIKDSTFQTALKLKENVSGFYDEKQDRSIQPLLPKSIQNATVQKRMTSSEKTVDTNSKNESSYDKKIKNSEEKLFTSSVTSVISKSSIIRATQSMAVDNILHEFGKENLLELPYSHVGTRKISRLHHPGGPTRFSRMLLGKSQDFGFK
ncbi:uncharacterized protein LOC107273416 isoform X2 [Cephus cinctus]|uniref:Uncharacterized protein LOC107273416 isoform X2 n=1 Tax=Cephus cinctus TaxID=211228 RepID=A0AAJ7W6N9_CEPCN|nr:uncharacterized protein LOC107273416 isoform X2 [Cephus cinctus]